LFIELAVDQSEAAAFSLLPLTTRLAACAKLDPDEWHPARDSQRPEPEGARAAT
jgi:hypothetical protein